MAKVIKSYTNQEIISALRKVKAGAHPFDVGRELNISGTTVCGWCKKANVIYERRFRNKINWEAIISQL